MPAYVHLFHIKKKDLVFCPSDMHFYLRMLSTSHAAFAEGFACGWGLIGILFEWKKLSICFPKEKVCLCKLGHIRQGKVLQSLIEIAENIGNQFIQRQLHKGKDRREKKKKKLFRSKKRVFFVHN